MGLTKKLFLSTILNIIRLFSESEYISNLEPKLVRLLSLVRDYKVAIQEYNKIQKQEYKELSEQSQMIEERNKKLKHLLETCHRVRTVKDDPPIPLGNGRYEITIEDCTRWEA